jgi:hypothetical protein
MLDALQPEGVTDLYVDSQFLLPHVGALLECDGEAARSILNDQAMVLLGTSICPVGPAAQPGAVIAKVEAGGESWDVLAGELRVLPLAGAVEANIVPKKDWDVGDGRGVPVKANLCGGTVGVILDGRGRPLKLPTTPAERVASLKKWYKAMSAYPDHESLAAAAGR